MKPLKLLSLALALTLLFSASCFAFPQSIWAPLGEYEAALASGDDQKITQIGETLVSIMEAEPDSSEKPPF